MEANAFLKTLDEPRLIAAIQRAERRTTGEVRVCILRKPAPDPMGAARQAAVRLGMDRTRDRNGVLILVAPLSQTFAVVGDAGIHDRCGDAFWAEVRTGLAEAFAAGRPTEGLEIAIDRVATALAQHFPPAADDTNELPDGIASI